MARPQKATVDYFPLDCKFSDEFEAVENAYGNNGFVVIVKLLQKLGRTEHHYIDIRNITQKTLFISIFRLPEKELFDILNMLSDLKYIDSELWKNKIIYSQNFVDSIADVYRNRKNDVPPNKELIFTLCGISDTNNIVSDVRNSIYVVSNPQTKLKETKLKETKFIKPTINEIKTYCNQRNNDINPVQFYEHYEANGWMVGKTPMKNWQAAIRTWEQNQKKDKTSSIGMGGLF